jgi:transglutaminase-like putative cysteine protease
MTGTNALARYGVRICALLLPLCVALALVFGHPRTTEPSQLQDSSRSSGDPLTTTLDELASALDTLQREVAREADTADAKGQLRRLRHTLEEAERLGAEDFAAIDAHLRNHSLPQVIRDRHAQAVDTYTSEMTALKATLDAVLSAPEHGLMLAQITKARERLTSYQRPPRWRRLDPSHLPMQALKPQRDHEPRLTVQEFRQANLASQPEVQPESTVLPASAGALPGADDPAFLAPTTEIVLTPAVQDRANALERNPVKIFAWASDHLEWNPGWGALQSAEHTLGSGRGNAIDLASALIALLRASGIPARYVHGTVEMDAERFKLLVGNFESAAAAIDYASASGLPIAAVGSGGRIARVRFEHVWVEAAVDFYPSRGAVNRVPDHWVGLDPAIKRAESLATPDYLALSGVPAEAAMRAFAASGTADVEAGWVQGLDGAALKQALTPTAEASAQVGAALQAFLQGNYGASDTTTVGQIAGGLKVTPRTDSMLPATLPYGVLVVGARYAQLPPTLQARATISLGLDADSADSVTLPMARVNNENLTLSFTFASAADHDTFVSFLPAGPVTELSQLPSSIPAYLLSVVPQIRLGEEVLMSAPAVRLGQSVSFGVDLNHPGVRQVAPHMARVVAGSQLSIVIFAGSANTTIFDRLHSRYGEAEALLATGSIDDILGYADNFTSRLSSDAFHAGALEYFARQVTMADFMTTGARLGRIHLVSGAASFGYRPTPRFWFGIPRTLTLGSLGFDAPSILVHAQSSTGDAERNRLLMQRFGMLGSALEGDVPAFFWSRDLSTPRTGASATNNLRTALESGQRIYHLTSRNSGSIAQLKLSADTVEDITAAVNAGFEVITHQSPIAVGGATAGLTSEGYVVLDPVTGAGQYMIDNGTNGGLSDTADQMMANCAYMNRPGFVNPEADWKRHLITRRCAEAAKTMNKKAVQTNTRLMKAKLEAVAIYSEVYAKIPMVIADCMVAGAPLALSEALVLVRTGAAMLAITTADLRSLAIAKHQEEVANALKKFVDTVHDACMGKL